MIDLASSRDSHVLSIDIIYRNVTLEIHLFYVFQSILRLRLLKQTYSKNLFQPFLISTTIWSNVRYYALFKIIKNDSLMTHRMCFIRHMTHLSRLTSATIRMTHLTPLRFTFASGKKAAI